jgi:putative DNA primase/helicase
VDLAREKLGIVATTSCGGHGGRNQWKLPSFAKAMKDKNVVLVPDHDQAGEEYIATVAASIVNVVKSLKIARLPGLPPKGDIEQWLAAGGTRDQLLALVEAAPLYGAEGVQPEEPETITLSTVEPRRIGWLWFGRLPLGEMVVITGRPGVGKGLLLCYIVARYTTGRPMHGDRVALPAGHVLWISMEDAHDTSLVPRLMAAGADLSRVHAWNLTKPLSLPVDADRIVAELSRLGCTLLIIDPAPTLLDKDHSSNNDANVRQSFAALSVACRELGCTMILVRHTNKRTLVRRHGARWRLNCLDRHAPYRDDARPASRRGRRHRCGHSRVSRHARDGQKQPRQVGTESQLGDCRGGGVRAHGDHRRDRDDG